MLLKYIRIDVLGGSSSSVSAASSAYLMIKQKKLVINSFFMLSRPYKVAVFESIKSSLKGKQATCI
ncbi:MAG: hypothetical protein JO327_12160 [Nitrososphaeraceae archaeon]|nr:hypothetical protein [Nitrososphaeraceae archaeon]MBV9668868.1 hypothetical protein [Nitrososphaeraceae archaeon]